MFLASHSADAALSRNRARSEHSVVYSLDAELARKRFWTFSVWEDQASLDAFAASDPHRAITRRPRPLMGPTRFEFFQVPDSDLPMTGHQVKAPDAASAARQHPVADGRGRRNGRLQAPGGKEKASMIAEDYGLARRMWHQLEPVHAVFWDRPADRPRAHGADPADAFDLVMPSLPACARVVSTRT